MGTMTFGGQADEQASVAMLDRCLEAGINFLDTANAYTGGRSEAILGRALKGRRDQVVLATKVAMNVGDAPEDEGLSAAAIAKQVEASLERLQTDYIDVYYLHRPDYDTPIDETFGALARLVEQGKVRHVALSNFAAWQVCKIHWHSDKTGHPTPTVTQPMYNLIARGIEQEYLPMCRDLGVASVVYNPLAGGMLTGKHKSEAPEAGGRFDGNANYLDRYWHDANFAAVQELEEVARGEGRSMVSLALNWILHHTSAECLILGASRMEQLEENLAALEGGPLSEEAVAGCDRVWDRLRGVIPKYNR
jgi:aryl-alcohol dehydrogenase-like predicted oxidoreductase